MVLQTIKQHLAVSNITRSVKGKVNYKVKIKEDVKFEGDPNHPCIDYKIRGQYAKCKEAELIRQNFEFLNCTPPWMTDNEADMLAMFDER